MSKMTDKQIIKEGLEHCIANDCGGCPNLATEYCSVFNNAIKRAKSEAIKEFAKKIDDEIYEALENNENVIIEREIKHKVNRYDDIFCTCTMGKNSALCGIHDFIVTLVKEMVGEQE